MTKPRYQSKRLRREGLARRSERQGGSHAVSHADFTSGRRSQPNAQLTLVEGDRTQDQDPLTNLNQKVLQRAFHIYVRQFPEFGFFHQPTFLKLLDNKAIPKSLLCGILALTARFIPELVQLYGTPWRASETFANHIRQTIMSQVATTMDINMGQTLLMLSLYDWGNGDGSRAWTYNGMATRIVHGIYAQAKESAVANGSFSNNIRLEEACRAVWACFLLDSMIGCGKCQASNFSPSISGIPLPLNEDRFAFGHGPDPRPLFLTTWDFEKNDYDPPSSISSKDKIGCDSGLTLIIQGFYIWQSISSWVSSGGRKRETWSSQEPPWRGHSFWSRSMAALEDWRASQSPEMVYSSSNMNLDVYISRNEGERFAIVNLLYHLSLIFLYREYMPLIPHSTSHPRGPVDPPLLLEEAPAGWWERSAQLLLEAASNIVQVMQELDSRRISFQTPFTSFCVFSATTALAYAIAWPHMVPGLDYQRSSTLHSWGSAWLRQSCRLWKVSNGWYRTMLTISQVYMEVKEDPSQVANVRRDIFPELEENIQRLAGSETTDLTDIPTANILLLLQRQQRLISHNNIQGSTALGTELSGMRSSRAQDISIPTGSEPGQDPLGDIRLLNSEPVLGQDLIANILSDPSGEGTSLFFDIAQFSEH